MSTHCLCCKADQENIKDSEIKLPRICPLCDHVFLFFRATDGMASMRIGVPNMRNSCLIRNSGRDCVRHTKEIDI